MLDKFYSYLDKILTESVEHSDNAIKKFIWKNTRYFRAMGIEDEQERIKFASKILDKITEELQNSIGKKIKIDSPSGQEIEIIPKEIIADQGIVALENPNATFDFQKKINWNIGMLMTDSAWELFKTEAEPYLKKQEEKRKAAQEEARKQKEAKKATYSNPEIENIIKSFRIEFGNFCYSKNTKFPETVLEKFKELSADQKQAVINYYDDFEFTDPYLEYADGQAYYQERDRLRDANDRKRTWLNELVNNSAK